MPGMQIIFVHRPVGVARHFVRCGLKGSPEIGDHPVQVVHVHGFGAVERPRSGKQTGAGAEKRFHVIFHGSEPGPNLGRGLAFSTEPRERGFCDGVGAHLGTATPATSRGPREFGRGCRPARRQPSEQREEGFGRGGGHDPVAEQPEFVNS